MNWIHTIVHILCVFIYNLVVNYELCYLKVIILYPTNYFVAQQILYRTRSIEYLNTGYTVLVIWQLQFNWAWTTYIFSITLNFFVNNKMKLFELFRKNTIFNPESNKKRKLRNVPVVEVRSRLFKTFSEVFYEYAHNTRLSGLYYLRRGITSGYIR